MNHVLAYWEAIESGKVVTSRRVRAVYERLAREIREPDPGSPYYFDEEVGERPILFAERFCKQSQGIIGAPLELELFQKAYIQALFGFLEKETGFRRYRETMFLVGRKNGKSTLLAAIALYLLIADYEGAAEIYSVATKKDQAKKVLTEAINMVKQSPELRAVLKKRRNDLYFPATAGVFEALASDSNTLDGLNSHAVIIDELHAIRDRNLYEVMKQSTSSRRQPLVIMITIAGTVRESVFDSIYQIACDIADGKMKEDTFLPILYELDSRDEWTDPTKWEKANPGLGTIKQYKTLAAFVERAKASPDDLPGVLCKDFNVREVAASVWLSFEEIKNDLRFKISEVYNTYAIGGCDLSATTDLTCATLLIRKAGDPTVYVLQQYFLPQKRIDLLDERNTNEAPYKIWAERGLLTICEGNRVDYSQVTAWFCQMRDEHKIDAIKVGYDRALAGYWVDEMKSNGFEMEPVAQGPLNKRRDDFVRDNLRMDRNGSGIIVTDSKYEYTPINERQTPIPATQLEYVRKEIYDYFGVNDDIIQNKADAGKTDAFYRGELSPFYMQLAQGLTNCIFTEREQSFGNEIFCELNRLQFAALNDRKEVTKFLTDIGALTLDQILDTFGYAPIGGEEGARRVQTLNMVNAALIDKYQLGSAEADPAPEPAPATPKEPDDKGKEGQ